MLQFFTFPFYILTLDQCAFAPSPVHRDEVSDDAPVPALLAIIAALLRSRESLRLEYLARRHQLAVYQQTIYRPRLSPTDRVCWAWLYRLWPRWQDARECCKNSQRFDISISVE